jgi:hypothetical protein
MLHSVDEARFVSAASHKRDVPAERLEGMISLAAFSRHVAYPAETFRDIVGMAMEAACTQDAPTFTMHELETMLRYCEGRLAVEMESQEFAALARLAMCVAAKQDPETI